MAAESGVGRWRPGGAAAAAVAAAPVAVAPVARRRLRRGGGGVGGRAALVLALLPLASGCGRTEDTPRRPPVVIVSIDTLRADRLPLHGYRGVETPALDALRRDAIHFERAYSHAPLTLPAHASLFTGRLPTEHGVRDNAGYRLDAATHPTLAAILRGAGYATGAAVSAYVVRGETGLAAGFDHYEDAIDLGGGSSLAEQQRPGLATLSASLPWLREAAARPFLYWLHIYEPHTPYTPPEPYRSRFASPYDGEIAAADAVVGELVRELRELDVYDRSLVVVLSDHGEGLGDHGEEEHGILLYREALQVPLLVKLPRGERAGDTVGRPVQLVDVFPTLLAAAGIETPPGLRGRSLLDDPSGRDRDSGRAARIYAETYYPRLHHGWSELRSIVAGDYHYIHGPDPELYDVVNDPQERRNLVAAEPQVAAALAGAVAEHAVEPAAPAAEDAEARRRLEALGYLSGPAPPAGATSGPLPDPKSQLSWIAALEAARGRFGAGDLDAAERELRSLVEAQPAMVDAWETLGDVLESGGHLERALEARRRAVEVSGGAAEQALKIAPLLLRLGRAEDAQAHARLAVEAFPETAHVVLARIAMANGDLEAAEREARQAVAKRSGTVTPVVTLTEILVAKGDRQAALQLIAGVEDELLARGLPDPRLFVVRAEVLLALGRGEEAERSLDLARREAERLLASHPGSPVGHGAIARVHELRGDGASRLQALERALAGGALDDMLKPALALEWTQRGRSREAAALVEPLAKRGDRAAAQAYAMALTESGDHAAARHTLEALLEHSPDEAVPLETLGLVELRLGDARAASRHLERAVALAPDAANAWNLLGVARWQGARDAAGAIAAWQRATAIEPQRLEVLQNLARVALESGRPDVARDALDRFVAQAPPDRFGAEIDEARRILAQLEGASGGRD